MYCTTGCHQGLIANKNIRRWETSGEYFCNYALVAANYDCLRQVMSYEMLRIVISCLAATLYCLAIIS
jgi:hypothetical protein